MIGRIRGCIIAVNPPLVLLEVGGIGYEVYMPITCLYELPEAGKEAIVFTHFLVREDAHLLFGFKNQQQRALFRSLIKTNGVGPKLALTILSGLTVQQFINIVQTGDLDSLVRIPGIGKKTAERLIVDMKDHFNDPHNDVLNIKTNLVFSSSVTLLEENIKKEAISALVSLGYKIQEANRMVNSITETNIDSKTLIRKALRHYEVSND